MKLNPKIVEEVEKAIYQARWVDAFGKSSVLATDEVLAKVAIETVLAHLIKKFNL